MSERRKLSAVDDPLTLLDRPGPSGPPPERTARPSDREPTSALYVRLPLAESDLLARAAFELRVFKRELVAALIAEHVDPHSEDGLQRLRTTLEAHSRRAE